MRILRLKCESDRPSFDQSIHAVIVEREDEENWYGRPVTNEACPALQWPKFAWKEITDEDGPGKRCNARLTQAPTFQPVEEKKSMQPNSTTNKARSITRFALGQTYITPGAIEALQIAGQTGIEFLRRHMSCDWGELSESDAQENELSIKEGFRILSAYSTAKGQKLWIITEADRSATTILLPSEY